MVTTTSQTVPAADGLKRSGGTSPPSLDRERPQESAKRDFRPAAAFQAAAEYATDFWQRSLLFLDILRQAGNKQVEMTSRPINAVLIYDHEVVLLGPNLPRPVNYALVARRASGGHGHRPDEAAGDRDRPAPARGRASAGSSR